MKLQLRPEGLRQRTRSAQSTENRLEALARKALLRQVYETWYATLVPSGSSERPQRVVEIGAAGNWIKQQAPQAFCSDLLPSSAIDFVANGMSLPLLSGSVERFVMINVFHHIPDARAFLAEILRGLENGGELVMIEPYNTLAGRLVWTCLHHEDFLPGSERWTVAGEDPLMDANGALPWIVFTRDRQQLEREFPMLSVDEVTPHTGLAYLLSGGFSRPQLVPSFFAKPIRALDRWLCRVAPQMALFATIRATKRSSHLVLEAERIHGSPGEAR